MITTEYSVAGPAHISIAIVADLHEFEPKPVLSRLAEIAHGTQDMAQP